MKRDWINAALRVSHDIGLAAWFGGAWMGAVSLNAATIEVDDHTQRTRVANAGWFRWAPVVGMAICAHVAAAAATGKLGWRGSPRNPQSLRRARTAVTIAAIAATAETGISGRRVVRAGDVPVATAVHPIAATPGDVADAQRRLRVAQWLVPAFTACLFVINSEQEG